MSNSRKQNNNMKKSVKSGPKAPKGSSKNKNGNTVINRKPAKQGGSKAYIASSRTQVSRVAKFQTTKTGCRQQKSELLFSVPNPTSAEFQVMKRIRINPLSDGTFKWLPSLARNYESFKFHYLRIRYENRCSAITPGSIILSPCYDAADSDAQASNESLLYENKGTKDFSVWKNDSLYLDIGAMNRLYKSHTNMSDDRFANTKQDEKTIDPCQVFICLDGVVPAGGMSTAPTGKIFLDYDVEFFEPHAPTEIAFSNGAVKDISIDTTKLSPASAIPIQTNSTITSIFVKNPANSESIVDPSYNPSSYPTATLLKFARDFEGILNLTANGTALNGSEKTGDIFVSQDPSTPAGYGSDLLTGYIDNINLANFSATTATGARFIKANAGDYLKWASPTFATLNNLAMQFSGTNII